MVRGWSLRFECIRVHAESLTALIVFFFSSRRRHTRLQGDWSSDVCSSDLSSSCDKMRMHHDRRSHGERDDGSGASVGTRDRKSTRLNSSHLVISYAVFCLKKKKKIQVKVWCRQ